MNFFFLAVSVACEITVPCQGWNLDPLRWKLGVLTTGLQGKSYNTVLITIAIMLYIRSSEFIHLIPRSLYPLTHISHPPAPHPITTILPSVSIAQPQLFSQLTLPSCLCALCFLLVVFTVLCRTELLVNLFRIQASQGHVSNPAHVSSLDNLCEVCGYCWGNKGQTTQNPLHKV